MAKRSKKKKVTERHGLPGSKDSHSRSIFWDPIPAGWMILFLAAVTTWVYWPSLKSDLVYDARVEILQEGFITSISNLPALLSLKVLGMNLMLGDRPGQMLYLMLIAAFSGKDPWGYHLCCNILHVANVALLFILLLRLSADETTGLVKNERLKVQLAVLVATLIFALHPIAVEAVAAVNYSSDLLVTFFTLLALLAAMAFQPKNSRSAFLMGGLGAASCFASVTCKESGLATTLVLLVYWFLFRRGEEKKPWFLFIGTSMAVTVFFLAARFFFAPPGGEAPMPYLGGSFSHVFVAQPQLWVFMMGKLLWPTNLSADYTLENMAVIPPPLAWVALIAVLFLQGWLARKSRMGALGVALYWLGLVTVSNFVPLYRIQADRFYYLPMAGVAMQIVALMLILLRGRWQFWVVFAPCTVALLPLTVLTLTRQQVFANETNLWADTLRASPYSALAHNGVALTLYHEGQLEEAIAEYRTAIALNPNFAKAHGNLGTTLLKNGQVNDAIAEYRTALKISPNHFETHTNLGNALLETGHIDDAIAEYQKSIALNPTYAGTHDNLGLIFLKVGRLDEAIDQFQTAVRLDPNYTEAQQNLAEAMAQAHQAAGAGK